MPVLFPKIEAEQLLPIQGLRLGTAAAGIKKPGRDDCVVMVLDAGASVAGVFTQNSFAAAPVQVCRTHLGQMKEGQTVRALVINTGCANAGTGAQGLADAQATCEMLAQLLRCEPTQILPFSTGVIMEYLPLDKLFAALPQACKNQSDWLTTARAIMTTDTLPKAVSRQILLGGQCISISGVSKGAGMIAPNMATMLGFVATDAVIPQSVLDEWLPDIAGSSFNAIVVDGDTSTNDSFIVMATGKVKVHPNDLVALKNALCEVSRELAQLIVRDAEGATKFITIRVEGGRNHAECRQISRAIALSPLVKTAFFAADPNLGRILCAIGYAGVENLDPTRIRLYLNEVLVAQNGGRAPSYLEEQGQSVMAGAEITVRVVLDRGSAEDTLWTCDLSHEYVSINADYRS